MTQVGSHATYDHAAWRRERSEARFGGLFGFRYASLESSMGGVTAAAALELR
jgi:hypothetical protein